MTSIFDQIRAEIERENNKTVINVGEIESEEQINDEKDAVENEVIEEEEEYEDLDLDETEAYTPEEIELLEKRCSEFKKEMGEYGIEFEIMGVCDEDEYYSIDVINISKSWGEYRDVVNALKAKGLKSFSLIMFPEPNAGTMYIEIEFDEPITTDEEYGFEVLNAINKLTNCIDCAGYGLGFYTLISEDDKYRVFYLDNVYLFSGGGNARLMISDCIETCKKVLSFFADSDDMSFIFES